MMSYDQTKRQSDWGTAQCPKSSIFRKILRNIFTKLNPLFRNAFVPTGGAGFMFVVGWQKVRVQGEECKRPFSLAKFRNILSGTKHTQHLVWAAERRRSPGYHAYNFS